MNDERIIPSSGQASVATVTILVDGKEIPPTIEVISIVTEHEANRVPFAKLVIRDGDVAAEDFPTSNESFFIPGKKIEILVGHTAQETSIFQGIVVKHGIKVRSKAAASLTVECRDEAVKMTVGRKSRFFLDKSDSDVIKELISEYGLKSDVATTASKHPELVQFDSRDWDFLLARAEANGMLVIVDKGNVSVKEPKLGGSADLSILLGDTIYELDAVMDARTQFKSVSAPCLGLQFSKGHGKEGCGADAESARQPDRIGIGWCNRP